METFGNVNYLWVDPKSLPSYENVGPKTTITYNTLGSFGQYGWICPVCGSGNSPTNLKCCVNPQYSQSSMGSNEKLENPNTTGFNKGEVKNIDSIENCCYKGTCKK